MPRTFIAVGSNLGQREYHLLEALRLVVDIPGVNFIRASAIHETEPEGGPAGQRKYLNCVWELEVSISARRLMDALLEIEKKSGRERKIKNEARPIDLDILFYGSQCVEEPGLTIPHPRLSGRDFVLAPLMEMEPDFIHPVLKKNVRELWEALHESHSRA